MILIVIVIKFSASCFICYNLETPFLTLKLLKKGHELYNFEKCPIQDNYSYVDRLYWNSYCIKQNVIISRD